MGVIKVENIRVYAYHGCMSEETTIGSDYRVDVSVNADLEKSSVTDALNDTVDPHFLIIHAPSKPSPKGNIFLLKNQSPILSKKPNTFVCWSLKTT